MKKLAILSLLAFGLTACQPAGIAPDISIEKASLRAPLPGQSTAVAYFDIVNKGGADVLLSATSNISDRVELHDHIHEGGIMKMRKVEMVAIPKNETVTFKSGGLHIMFLDSNFVEPVTLTLDFEKHDDLTIQMIANIN